MVKGSVESFFLFLPILPVRTDTNIFKFLMLKHDRAYLESGFRRKYNVHDTLIMKCNTVSQLLGIAYYIALSMLVNIHDATKNFIMRTPTCSKLCDQMLRRICFEIRKKLITGKRCAGAKPHPLHDFCVENRR